MKAIRVSKPKVLVFECVGVWIAVNWMQCAADFISARIYYTYMGACVRIQGFELGYKYVVICLVVGAYIYIQRGDR